METLWQDLRYGIRMMLKKPGFTLVAVIALALGIGANTAIFSVVNSILLRPLPYEEPNRMVWLWEENKASNIEREPASSPNFVDWRSQNQVFEEMACFAKSAAIITGDGEPERFSSSLVSHNFFTALRAKPLLGRTFIAEEAEKGKNRVAVLSHGLWQRRFGSDQSIVGKSITINGNPFQVIGVMQPSFKHPHPTDSTPAELWTPIVLNPGPNGRRSDFLNVLARLKPGVSLEQSQAEMKTIASRLEQQYPDANTGFTIQVLSLSERFVGDIRPALLVLLGAVGFLLLIACANVANLLLARATSRQKEIAIRTALGAGRWRLVRQLLTESLVLSAVGGVSGLLLSFWGIELLVSLSPANIPRINEVALDLQVLGFTFLLSLATGVIFGLIPAIQASRPNLNETMKEGGRSATEGVGRHRVRSLIAVTEIALALVLLIGAGLMMKSFLRLQNVDPGFNPENILSIQFVLPRAKYGEPHQVAAFHKQLVERVKALPGVTSVSTAAAAPFSGGGSFLTFTVEGRPELPPGQTPDTEHNTVSTDYFRTMGIRLLKGRFFSEQDTIESPPVAVINETMARSYFPDEDPIGKKITVRDPKEKFSEIVGIVADVQHTGLDAKPYAQMYELYEQRPQNFIFLLAKTAVDPLSIVPAIRTQVAELDKDQPLYNISTMDRIFSESISGQRFNTLLIAIFAVVALVLTAVGIYGVIPYSVSQRTHEIGIRLALGAQSGDVLKMVLGQGLRMAALGVAIGLVAAFALTRVLSSLLYTVSTTDAVTFAGIPFLLIAVALLASFIPARKAIKVDPMIALRYE